MLINFRQLPSTVEINPIKLKHQTLCKLLLIVFCRLFKKSQKTSPQMQTSLQHEGCVSIQTRTSAFPVSQLKHGSSATSASQFKREPARRISTIEQNPRGSRFCYNCPITGLINTYIMWRVVPNYRGILEDNFISWIPL